MKNTQKLANALDLQPSGQIIAEPTAPCEEGIGMGVSSKIAPNQAMCHGADWCPHQASSFAWLTHPCVETLEGTKYGAQEWLFPALSCLSHLSPKSSMPVVRSWRSSWGGPAQCRVDS